MLDNLKLGYGGTASEMYRLLQRAAELDETFAKTAEFSIDSKGHLTAEFSDITQAIHIVQEEMGIAGATAEEAATTISGSLGMLKASWQNVLTALSDDNASGDNMLYEYIQDLVDSATIAFENLMPVIRQALEGATELIDELFPIIMEMIPQIIEENLPKIVTSAIGIIRSIVTGISENKDRLISSAIQIIQTIASGLIELLPDIIMIGLDLIVALGQGLIQYLPELVDSILEIIGKIVDTLTDETSLKNLIETALTLVLTIAEGLVKALPQLISAAFDIILSLVDYLLDPANIGTILDAAWELVKSLGKGLIDSAWELATGVGELISEIWDAITETDWLQVGKDVVNGLLKGIQDMWNSLTKWVTDAWDDLVGGIKDFLGIESPSKLFAEIGRFMAEGVQVGWDDEFPGVSDGIIKSMNFADGYVPLVGGVYGATGASDYTSGDINITQNIYSQTKSAAELMQEALWQAKVGVKLSV